MIKNEKQYRISKKKAEELADAIERINNDPKKDPLRKEVLSTSLIMAKQDIDQEILEYEKLKKDRIGKLKERLFADLPSLLIEYKIKSGLTQKEFAAQLGIKEQQLQRYEADNFRSVTFKNLLRFLDAIGLEVTIKETRMTRTNKNKPQKNTILQITMSIHLLGRNTFGDVANTGNLMPIEEAHQLLNEWVPNDRLRLHMKQVAAVMKAWAFEKEQADELTARKWELAGLLHDADWEKHPDDHCRIIIEELERRNIDPEVIHCIASHGPRYFGVEPNNTMDKMIYVFDELSGFIHAAALIRPTRYEGMDVKSVLKKLKTPSFAAQVNRDDITDAIARINIPLEEIIQFIIDHQKDIQ